MKRIFRSIVLVSLFLIFGNSARVTLRVMRPAQIDVGNHIQRVVILNRAYVEKTFGNILEGGLTGETIGQDEQGLRVVIDALYDFLAGSDRFEAKRATEQMKGQGAGNRFPVPLDWARVEQLCRKYQVDALIAVEMFDSDFIITRGNKVVTRKDDNGNEIKVTEYHANGVAAIDIGMRLYDPARKDIIDEYHFNRKSDWNAGGSTAEAAVASLINRKEAVKKVSRDAGIGYATRITPTWYNVTRYFYNRPKRVDELQAGVRMSEVADWEGAIEMWKKVVDRHKKSKFRGRAAYNIAVAYEVLGDMDTAIQWASDAYTRFGEKKANDYVRTLKKRKNSEAIAREQLGMIE